MAIETKIIPAIVNGLDTSADIKLSADKPSRLMNVRFPRKGAIGCRPGWWRLDDIFGDGYLATFEDKFYKWDDKLEVQDMTLVPPNFTEVGDIPVMDCYGKDLSTVSGKTIGSCEWTELLGIRCVATVEADVDLDITHYISTYDISTGKLIQRESLGYVADLSQLICFSSNSTIIYAFVDTTGHLRVGTVDADGTINVASQWATYPTVELTGSVVYRLDHCFVNGPGYINWIAYVSDEGAYADLGIVASVSSTGTADGYYGVEGGDCGLINVYAVDDNVGAILVYEQDSPVGNPQKIYAGQFDEDFVSVMSWLELKSWDDATEYPIFMTGCSSGESDNQFVFFNWHDEEYTYPEWTYNVRTVEYKETGGSGALTKDEQEFIEGVSQIAKPYYEDGYAYTVVVPVVAIPGDILQSTAFVIRDDRLAMAKAFEGQTYPSSPTSLIDTTCGDRVVARKALIHKYYADDTHGLGELYVDNRVPFKWRKYDEIPGALCIDGGIPTMWDGQSVVEVGFLMYPPRISCSAGAGSSDLDAPSTYGYCATYEWYDGQGRRHQSAPSVVTSVDTNTGNNKITVHVPPLTITEKENVNVVLWRTEGYGSYYYKVSSAVNSPFAAYEEFEDTLSDSSLLNREALYTNGGIIENIAPPSTRVSCEHQGRLFYVDRSRAKTTIIYSKEFEDREGVSFSDSLTINLPYDGGEIMALHSFMDRLVIFKKNRIYTLYGQSVDDLGLGSGYSVPTMLHAAIGCDNQNTIVEIPDGLCFKAADGSIYMITKAFQVTSIGDPVTWWSDNHEITCGIDNPIDNEAMWFIGDGYGLIYNWNYGLWSTWMNGFSAFSCARIDEKIEWLWQGGDGYLHWLPGENDYIDRSSLTSPSVQLETGWYSFAGLMDYQRVRKILILGQMESLCDLTVKIAYDFEPYWQDVVDVVADGYYNASDYSQYFLDGEDVDIKNKMFMFEVHPSRQKSTSIRLHLATKNVETGAGLQISGLAFEVGKKKGPMKLDKNRKEPQGG